MEASGHYSKNHKKKFVCELSDFFDNVGFISLFNITIFRLPIMDSHFSCIFSMLSLICNVMWYKHIDNDEIAYNTLVMGQNSIQYWTIK